MEIDKGVVCMRKFVITREQYKWHQSLKAVENNLKMTLKNKQSDSLVQKYTIEHIKDNKPLDRFLCLSFLRCIPWQWIKQPTN